MMANFMLLLICMLLSGCGAINDNKKITDPKLKISKRYDDYPVAFSVARTNTESSIASKLQLPDVVVDIGDGWDASENDFLVPEEGVYFFHMNAGAEAEQRINMDLQGTQNQADILRFSTAHDGTDTLGRDFISNVSAGTSVFIENIQGSVLYSQGGRQTSFSAFDLGNYMQTEAQTIFSVARAGLFSTTGTVNFDQSFVNIGNAFDQEQNAFVAPSAGIYYLTATVGVLSSSETDVTIRGSTVGVLAVMERTSTNYNGVDMISASLLTELPAGEVVTVNMENGELYSDGEHQTSFSGFLYNPVNGEAAAWSVYRTSPLSADNGTTLDPVPFDEQRVNTDDMFDFDENQVNINQSGIYFVHLNVIAEPEEIVDVSVVRYRYRSEFNIFRDSLSHNGTDTLTQGLLLKLSEGDALRVVNAEGSSIFSDEDGGTRFSGFMVTSL